MQTRSIDGFEIVRELGRGGMGVVYEARHPSLPRSVALKLILESAADADALARFGREAELLARVNHRNVLKIHKLGRAADGPYLVTEMLEGQDLKELTRNGPLPPQQAATILSALAKGLVAVHAQGVLHRDLKPQNVFVRTDGTPVLLDFGLARDVGAEKLTQTGVTVGTPAYMAPEQAGEGSTDDLDVRSDVYGLGGVLFRTLAGRAPFQGNVVSILKQVLFDDPRWPSKDEPNTPSDLEAICKQAMAKQPDDRYSDAQALSDDLDRYLAGKPVLARPPASKPRRVFALAGAVLLGVLGVVTGVAVELRGQGVTEGPTVSGETPPEVKTEEGVREPVLRKRWEVTQFPAQAQSREITRFVKYLPRVPGEGLQLLLVTDDGLCRVSADPTVEPPALVLDRVLVFARKLDGLRALEVDPKGRFAVLGLEGRPVLFVGLDEAAATYEVAVGPPDAVVTALAVSGDRAVVYAGYAAGGQSRVVAISGPRDGVKPEILPGLDVPLGGPGEGDHVGGLGLLHRGRTLVGVEVDPETAKDTRYAARFWDAETLEVLGDPEKETFITEGATSLAVSPDGRTFAIGLRYHGIRIYKAPSFSDEPFSDRGGVPEAEVQVCRGEGATEHVSATEVTSFTRAAHSAPPRQLVFSPSGERLLSVSGRRRRRQGGTPDWGHGDLRVFDVRSGKQVGLHDPGEIDLRAVGVVLDDAGEPLIAQGVYKRPSRILRAPHGVVEPPLEIPSDKWEPVSELEQGELGTHRVAFVPGPTRAGGPHVVTLGVGRDSKLKLWSLADAKKPVPTVLKGVSRGEACLAVDPKGDFAIIGGADSRLTLVELFPGTEPRDDIDLASSMPKGEEPLQRVDFLLVSPDSRTAYLTGFCHLRDERRTRFVMRVDLRPDAPKPVAKFVEVEGYRLRGLVFGAGNHLISGDNDSPGMDGSRGLGPSHFRVFSQTFARLTDHERRFARTNDGVTAMAAGPNGYLAVAARRHGLRFYQTEATGTISATRWEASPRGSRLHVTPRLSPNKSLSDNYSPPAAHAPSRGLGFAREGTLLFAASGDQRKGDQGDHGDVRIFDSRTGRLLTRYSGTSTKGESKKTGLDFETLAVSPDGSLVFAGQRDGSVLVLRPPPSVLSR